MNNSNGLGCQIVAIGEPMVEFSAIPGEASRYLRGFGGDTMNALIAAVRHGASAAYVSRVGADEFGQSILNLLDAEGVDRSAVKTDTDAPTGCYFITHGSAGHEFSYRRAGSAASRMTPGDVPPGLLGGVKFLHASGISQAISASACDAVFAAMEQARADGTAVCFDSNLRLRLWPLARARAVIEAAAGQSDYFLPSLEDAALLSGVNDPDAIFDWALRLGAKNIALKLGPGGVLAGDANTRTRLAGHDIRLLDATGAGDCFAGSLLARLAAGDSFLAACRYANASAALTCEGLGAIAPIPSASRVLERLGQSGS
jgi:2-dehydro-3-deoxygluconokinase